MSKHHHLARKIAGLILLIFTTILVFGSFSTIWAITLPVPDFETFFTKQIAEQSMKIYDRTGQILLYDVKGVRRTVVPFKDIPQIVKNATLAIEDAGFYTHQGVQPSSIARAFITDVISGGYHQGGSTITQQVVKNSLLTRDKTITRKVKELVLSVKLEKSMAKDEIFNIYLNQSPYGSNIYGVQEAARAYFHKDITQVTLAEAAYLAALPKAPNYYSPYGQHKAELEARKNLVLDRMVQEKFITKAEVDKAKRERVAFYEKINQSIKAPHFVIWLKEQLAEQYGADNIESNNFKVISTIDWNLQQKVEEIAAQHGTDNATKFKAGNNSVVIIDPKTGQILALTGSRDYFNKEIQGNFNVATAYRQPGSSFKPFVYATAFNKGYTDQTMLFDLKTEFNTNCRPNSRPLVAGAVCYTPSNYDGKYVGPISLRNALAQSRNVPSVKLLYLAGVNDSLATARNLGITSLGTKNQYGLTLVLGGGEVSLLEMVGAYSVFATEGVKRQTTGVLRIEGPSNNVLEQYQDKSTIVLPVNTARLISNILSDEAARAPGFGSHSYLYFNNRQVAVKTGTTNDYRDGWTIGYTPNIVVGVWVGNNDNTPMEKKAASTIAAPLWHALMKECLNRVPDEKFIPPIVDYSNLKPVLRGYWQGGVVENIAGQDTLNINVHSILYWVDRNNPLGPAPTNPTSDQQFNLWEYPIQQWLKNRPLKASGIMPINQPTGINQVQLLDQVNILSPADGSVFSRQDNLKISLLFPSNIIIKQLDYLVDNEQIYSSKNSSFNLSIIPKEFDLGVGPHELKVVIHDQIGNTVERVVNFTLNP